MRAIRRGRQPKPDRVKQLGTYSGSSLWIVLLILLTSCHVGHHQNAMKKLQKQAHDALNRVHATEEMTGIHTELERLGGKTHLICPTAEKVLCSESDRPNRSGPANHNGIGHPSTPPAAASPTTVASPILQASGVAAFEPPLQPDMIHPTIMEDMQRFDMEGFDGSGGVQFNMDFPPTVFDPRQAVDFSAFSGLDFTVGLAMPGVGSSSDVWMDEAGGSGMGVHGVNGGHVNGSNGLDGMNGVSGLVGVNGNGRAPNAMGGMDMGASGPPVLDATWQALVEQLGF